MAHWQFSRAAGVAVVLLACLGAAEGQWYRNPVRAVEQAVRNPVSVVRDTVTAPVRPLQQAVERLPCSCKSGHITDKWDKQEALERKFCNGARCSTGCCGGVEYGQQVGSWGGWGRVLQHTPASCAHHTDGSHTTTHGPAVRWMTAAADKAEVGQEMGGGAPAGSSCQGTHCCTACQVGADAPAHCPPSPTPTPHCHGHLQPGAAQ
jgi:hypothetical protein